MPLKPDPTFYPSPASAIEGPAEELAYVVTLNTSGDDHAPAKPDALTVIDVKDGSSTKGQVIGRLDMPNVGDELHHFGWNACSSALCPWAPHPHVERRYLLIPGLRSSRIHVVDVKDDPANPKLVKVVEAEELAKRTGYSRPHTVHCGPDGLYVSALGNPGGDGPGGVLLLDHDDFSPLGQWEIDRGPQNLAYDVWWNIGYDTLLTSEWGTPNMVEDGLNPELLGQYGRHLHVWDLKKRRHTQAIDLGAEQQMVLELRPAHDPTRPYGFVGVVVSTADLSASVWLWERQPDGSVGITKVIEIPAEPAETDQLPPALHPFGRAPPRPPAGGGAPAAHHRHRAERRRQDAARLLLGHRRAQALRRQRPAQPQGDRLGAPRRHRPPRAAPGGGRADRRAPDGRDEPRRQGRPPDQPPPPR